MPEARIACPECGQENPEQARFCLHCGAKLAAACPQCGVLLPLQARFCSECGAEVDGPPPAAGLESAWQRLIPKAYAERLQASRGQAGRERRTVTVLFCDVKGSTAMAEGLDPEDWMEIMDGAFDVLIEPIYRHEGTLARLMGDAVLAFFGAPLAHEDDPERACRAALEIVSGAQAYAAQLEAERGIAGFNVRVGIHTGLVVVGEVGSDLRSEYTAMGDAVNLAARMEQAAEPGTVLISGATHKLVAPLFRTEALGPVAVKGKVEPVPVYRVLAAKEGVVKPRGIAGLASPLVGREPECAALKEALARLQEGQGGVATIVGEAGIGKSRLVAELRSHTEAHSRAPLHASAQTVGAHGCAPSSAPLRWVEGRCLSYGGSIAYLLWLDVLRGLLGVTLEDAPADVDEALQAQVRVLCPDRVDEVYPYLARLLSLPLADEVAQGLEDLEGRELREQTFAAVETVLTCACQRQPLVLICEDLHWADPTSLQLLERLLPLSERLPLLALCVFRPVREHRVWELRQQIAEAYGPCHTGLVLEPLSEGEGRRLVGNLLFVDDLPIDLKDGILSRAEGNPFYLEEILRALIDQGTLVQEEASGLWRTAGEAEELLIPDTLAGVLVARIDRLQEETRRVLQLASVIGRVFLHCLLAEIAVAEAAAYEELRLDHRLGTLQREDLIRERARLPELEYIFKHDLTREAAYNGLLKRDRRTYHRQVAEALEQLFPERIQEMLGLLAYHWERAAVADKAIEYLSRAGDQSRLAYSHEEAVNYYERALAFLEELQENERTARMQMKLGLTYDSAFDFRRAREAYEEGFALWQRAAVADPVAALPPAPHALRLHCWEPSRLDPGMGSSLSGQLFSGLVDHTPNLSIVPDVAASWDLSDGGRRYVFHLRGDVVWSDGVPVTAGDFEYAWQRLLDPATGWEDARMLYDIRGARAFHQGRGCDLGVQALDDATLSVELEEPTGYVLHLLACHCTYPVPRHVVEAHGFAWANPEYLVTNGPFTLDSWQPGESMVLERYPRYHGPVAGNLHRVELAFFQEGVRSGPLEMYQAGLSDVLELPAQLGIKTMERLRQSQATEWISLPSANTGVLIFDAARPPFDDARVRRAFAHALDRERLCDVVWGGFWQTATGGFVPPGLPGHSPGIALAYDPAQGQELLTEAGYPGGAGFPAVEMWGRLPESPEYWDHPLVGQWNKHLNLNIKMRWGSRSAEYGDSLDRAPPDIYFSAWMADYPDPDNYLRVAVQSFSAWHHEGYFEMVERARRTLDQVERMKLYAQAEHILAEEVPILPVDYDRKHFLIKPWVRSYPRSAAGTRIWKDVVIEPH